MGFFPERVSDSRFPSGMRRGFTLIEVLVVVAILMIMAAMLLPNAETIMNRADRVICTGKLRNLWTVFSTRLNDGQGWPQLPPNVRMGTTAEQQWWITSTSNSMGLTLKDWRCPSFSRSLRRSTTTSEEPYLISYLPSLFDDKPATPRRWGRMPWFTEVAGSHGGITLSVRADGSVCPAADR